GAQNQVEIAKRVWPGDAHTGQSVSRWIVARKACAQRSAVSVDGAGCSRYGGETCAQLRKQLAADLLKALIVYNTTRGQHVVAAAIDCHADFNTDVGRSARNTRVDLCLGE